MNVNSRICLYAYCYYHYRPDLTVWFDGAALGKRCYVFGLPALFGRLSANCLPWTFRPGHCDKHPCVSWYKNSCNCIVNLPRHAPSAPSIHPCARSTPSHFQGGDQQHCVASQSHKVMCRGTGTSARVPERSTTGRNTMPHPNLPGEGRGRGGEWRHRVAFQSPRTRRRGMATSYRIPGRGETREHRVHA